MEANRSRRREKIEKAGMFNGGDVLFFILFSTKKPLYKYKKMRG